MKGSDERARVLDPTAHESLDLRHSGWAPPPAMADEIQALDRLAAHLGGTGVEVLPAGRRIERHHEAGRTWYDFGEGSPWRVELEPEPRALLTIELHNDRGEPIGWAAVADFRLIGEAVDLHELTFRRTVEGAPNRGATLLRQLQQGALNAEAERWFRYDVRARFTLPPSWFDSWAATPRPGRAGRDDTAYAVWAARYVDALEAEPRAPIAWLLERYGVDNGGTETEAGLRAKLNKARARGLLTAAPPGRAGGELTDKGRALARLAGEEG